jgi:ATP-dependent RNA helicase RhlE
VITEGYEIPTPIQMQAIPPVMDGRDLLGIAQTGTGKTAAFALPILHRLAADPHGRRPGTTRCLVLVPTRELAIQVRESFDRYGAQLQLRTTCIFGGVGEKPQKDAMARGVDIVVATPGRLLDLLGQRALTLKSLSILVLDEADRMLDMGFIHDIRRIVALLPVERQNLFFSATMPPDAARLASSILRSPVRIEVTPSATPIEVIDQIVYVVEMKEKQPLLKALLQNKAITRALVFTRTKHGANKLCEGLMRGGISAAAIHGNKSQNRRQEALAGFQTGAVRILVATDIAARGIDVDEVSHVFNFDIPEIAETYVHRIGRTARAGASGSAIGFCAPEELGDLAAIERLIRRKIPRGDARTIVKAAHVAPDSIHSTTGRFDRDLGVYLPPARPAHENSRRQGFRPPAHRENAPHQKPEASHTDFGRPRRPFRAKQGPGRAR